MHDPDPDADPAVDSASAESPSTADRLLLLLGAELHRPLARATKWANANGLGYAVFGVLSLMLAVVGLDLIGLAIGAILLSVGVFECAQAKRLVRADLAAPLQLARGELVLLGTIVVYGILGLTVLPSAGETLKHQIGNTAGLGMNIARLADSINTAWYAGIIAIALLYQGGMARYFLKRREDVARYRKEVPASVRQFVESMAS